ncbi:MAG: ATP-binding protein [Butyribacter sp.]|nr:ATP-binding protein [bacterium]MDY3854339.1 ATP-binding protein [Butyribacter sp.]
MIEQVMWKLFETMVSSLEIIIHTWFFYKNARGLRKSRFQLVMGNVFLVGILFFCDYFKIPINLKLFLIMLSSFFVYRYLMDIELDKAIVSIICCIAAIVFSEAAVMGLLGSLHNYHDLQIFMQENFYRLESIIMAKIIHIVFLYFAQILIKRERKEYWKKELLLFLLQTFTSLLVVLMAGETSTATNGDGWFSPALYAVLAFCALIAYMCSLWITENYFTSQELLKESIRVDAYKKRKEDYAALQAETQRRVQRLYHDLKTHISAIYYMKGTDADALDNYMSEINQSVIDFERFYDSGCDVLDMLLLEKQDKAEKYGILFDLRVEEGCLEKYSSFLLCTIFGNAIDNAIEANIEESEDNRFVFVQVQHYRKVITIRIENSYQETPDLKDSGFFRSRKKDKNMHGIGVKSIEDAVAQLGGKMDIVYRKGVFKLFISLPPL